MRLFIVILTAFLCGLVSSLDSNSKDGTVFIDSLVDVTTINANHKIKSRSSESSGDEEDGSGDVQGDSSGESGSGDVLPTTAVAPTEEENVVNSKTVPVKKIATAKSTTEPVVLTTETPEIMTEEVREIVVTSIVPLDTTKPTTEEEDMFGGGIGKSDSPAPDGNVEARKQERDGLRVLSKEVIVAVIIGGICAIILIAFLVYRLRKRDEGSYVLTDSAYKDTNKLRGDPGKEAFV